MAATVSHRRPEAQASAIEVGAPVSGARSWVPIGGMANWASGHGGMLIPWCAMSYEAEASLTYTLNFLVSPKPAAVERVWGIFARSVSGAERCDFTAGSLATQTVDLAQGRTQDALIFREPLSASVSTAEEVSVVVAPSSAGGNVVIEAIACYEQTRPELRLDTTDYGVDLSSLTARQPIADVSFESMRGVATAVQNMTARRAGYFHVAIPEEDPLSETDGGSSLVFPFDIPLIGAVDITGETNTTVTVGAYMRVSAGTGDGRLTVDSANASDTVVCSTSSTSYQWVTETLTIETENLASADGLPAAGMERLTFTLDVDAGETVDLAGISVIREGSPI